MVTSQARALEISAALNQEFEELCQEFTSPDAAKQFGSAHEKSKDGFVDDSPDDFDNTTRAQPKKGSLRVFAQQVLEKVSEKGCTTYQRIADELISELQEYKRVQGGLPAARPAVPESKRRRTCESAAAEDDGEKNIRRRVYDSLNVLKAVGAVIPLKGLTGTSRKEILWVGLPAGLDEVNGAHEMQEALKARIQEVQQWSEQLQALQNQLELLSGLVEYNRQRSDDSAEDLQERIPLPFVVLSTDSDTQFDISMSSGDKVGVFDFHSSPFQVVEDYVLLQQMGIVDSDNCE